MWEGSDATAPAVPRGTRPTRTPPRGVGGDGDAAADKEEEEEVEEEEEPQH